jgi:2-polyprenyl-3-methyl-5-hydroxy-6-metoxy-1,4-benzoquinol methylase
MDPKDNPEVIALESQDFWTNSKIRLLLDLISKEKIKSIMDAGCGSGYVSYFLSKKGYSVWAVDKSKKILNSANKRYKNKNLKFVNIDLSKKVPNKKFDCILLLDVLEHVKDDLNFLKNIKKNLKKGGILIVKVPAYQILFGAHDKYLGHYRRYSKKGILNLVKSVGFKVEEIRYWDLVTFFATLILGKFTYMGSYHSSAVRNKLLSDLILKYLDFERKIKLPFGGSLVGKFRLR